MISLATKVKLGFNNTIISFSLDRWFNQYGWGLSLTIQLLCFVEFKFSLTRAYGKGD